MSSQIGLPYLFNNIPKGKIINYPRFWHLLLVRHGHDTKLSERVEAQTFLESKNELYSDENYTHSCNLMKA